MNIFDDMEEANRFEAELIERSLQESDRYYEEEKRKTDEKGKKCKKCEHYVRSLSQAISQYGICVKDSKNVQIVKESNTCVWDKAEMKGDTE